MNKQEKFKKLLSNTVVDGELVEKKKSEIMVEPSFVQNKMSCACGGYHTITLSNDGTAHSFGYNGEGALGLGHNHLSITLPTPIPNLPQINFVSCGGYFTV